MNPPSRPIREAVRPLNDPVHTYAIEVLAAEVRLPPERVAEVYAAELERLMVGARIEDYLPVLTSRRVKQILRGQAAGQPGGTAQT